MTEPIVKVEDVTKIYEPSPGWMRFLVRSNLTKPVKALDGVNFEVGPGETMAIVGPNGAGKSTAFRILVGLTSPTSGHATIMGHDCTEESQAIRRLIGWMPAEDRSLLLRLSCRENLRFHGRLHEMEMPGLMDRVDEVLLDVGLADFADASPFALSAGMRARLQLARALLHNPQVIILDEPTGSVDPVAAHALLGLIIDIVEEKGLAALISSHRLEEIEALHSHVVLLDKGMVRYDGDLDELRSRYDRARVELEFTDSQTAVAVHDSIRNSGLIEHSDLDTTVVTVTLKAETRIQQIVTALQDHGDKLTHVRDSRTPLRDVLAAMYREQRG